MSQPDHHPDYGTNLDGDVYCIQCHKNDYTDEDDGLCDKCREENEPKPEPDFHVANHGSIFILTGLTDACREWIEANVGDDETQTWGKHGIVVEHRYIADIVQGLQNEGFIGS